MLKVTQQGQHHYSVAIDLGVLERDAQWRQLANMIEPPMHVAILPYVELLVIIIVRPHRSTM